MPQPRTCAGGAVAQAGRRDWLGAVAVQAVGGRIHHSGCSRAPVGFGLAGLSSDEPVLAEFGEPVVRPAQRHQVVQVGGTAQAPRGHVVRLGVRGGDGAAGDRAAAAPRSRPARAGRRRAGRRCPPRPPRPRGSPRRSGRPAQAPAPRSAPPPSRPSAGGCRGRRSRPGSPRPRRPARPGAARGGPGRTGRRGATACRCAPRCWLRCRRRPDPPPRRPAARPPFAGPARPCSPCTQRASAATSSPSPCSNGWAQRRQHLRTGGHRRGLGRHGRTPDLPTATTEASRHHEHTSNGWFSATPGRHHR